MTDRIKGFTIALDNDIRVDEIEYIVNAIKMIKGVNNVEPLVADSTDFIARSRYKQEVLEKMYKLLREL